ncbi:NmrA family transcriptional regulator [Streptomyces armeniacus]|uniref:NmrA family transcriptional regulator n=1 Tax=Streptomyces armeniacus TaxID=83291 RepID=A0A345XPM0_9ACTN|nr:NmrA family NAD(P)-binding protein [Streptomyces armeniacus]AXK33586.1 NmrA family transcriptional regulator [Streptomyces armeniacus]
MTTNGENTQKTGHDTTLVIGGTGKTGRLVAERLTALGRPVRIGSRAGDPPFVWEDPGTWEAAVAGVGAAYVTYYPDLAFPGAAEAVGAFSRYAAGRGVRRLVLLSGRGEEGARRSERELREAGADWTVVRASWFHQNFSESFFLEPVLGGELALPVGDSVEAFVDTEDIADVAVAALTEDGHAGEVYELSGPRLLSFHDVAAILSEGIGREVRYVPVTVEQFRAVLAEEGLPQDFAGLFELISDGRNAHLTDGVRRALGREPRDFADYVRRTAATGVWSAGQG